MTQGETLAGYVTNGITQDRVGRRAALGLFTVGEAVMMVIFLLIVTNSAFMYLMAGYGSIVTENFPTRIRITAAEVTYNLTVSDWTRNKAVKGPGLFTRGLFCLAILFQ